MGGFYFQNVMDVFTDEKVITQIIMKKIFIALAALATLVACNKEAAIETPEGDAIGFGDAFVDNATKAIYESAADLTAFKVWGNVKGTNATPLALYGDTGANVTYTTNWDCDVVRYWTPSASYNFTAIANGIGKNCENGIPTTISYTQNSADPADLLFGAATAATTEACVPGGDIEDGRVAFTLRHLLARVKVQFENQIAADGYTYDITNVKITTAETGVYTIGAATPWAPAADDVELTYTDIIGLGATVAPAGAQLIIPGASVDFSFDYVLKFNGTGIYNTTVTKTITTELAEGHSYNLNVLLKAGNKIDFTIVNDNLGWTDGASSNI